MGSAGCSFVACALYLKQHVHVQSHLASLLEGQVSLLEGPSGDICRRPCPTAPPPMDGSTLGRCGLLTSVICQSAAPAGAEWCCA